MCLGTAEPEIDPSNPIEVHLSQASHADYIDKKICMDVMVSGKDIGPYGYPKKLKISCTPDNGNKCAMCVRGCEWWRTYSYLQRRRQKHTAVDRLHRCTGRPTVIKGKAGILKPVMHFMQRW